jgi:hypothetical protein
LPLVSSGSCRACVAGASEKLSRLERAPSVTSNWGARARVFY